MLRGQHYPIRGTEVVLRGWSRSPEVQVQAGSVPCTYASLPASISTFIPERSNTRVRGAKASAWRGLGFMTWQSFRPEVSVLLLLQLLWIGLLQPYTCVVILPCLELSCLHVTYHWFPLFASKEFSQIPPPYHLVFIFHFPFCLCISLSQSSSSWQ